MASPLVLFGVPCERHIPYFAMPVPRSRESYAQRLDLETDLGRRCAAWVRARATGAKIELIKTRNYVPPQTAFYATWLVFGDEAVSSEFLDAYPQHQLGGRIATIEADHQALAAKLQNRLQRGDFNLGRIGDERQRENLARRYVEAAEHQQRSWPQRRCCGHVTPPFRNKEGRYRAARRSGQLPLSLSLSANAASGDDDDDRRTRSRCLVRRKRRGRRRRSGDRDSSRRGSRSRPRANGASHSLYGRSLYGRAASLP